MQSASQILLRLSLGFLTQFLSGTGFLWYSHLLSCGEEMESAEGHVSIIRLPLTDINVLAGGLVRLSWSVAGVEWKRENPEEREGEGGMEQEICKVSSSSSSQFESVVICTLPHSLLKSKVQTQLSLLSENQLTNMVPPHHGHTTL